MHQSFFDDDLAIAGQGTVGLEILEDLPEVSVVVVPVGGGLTSCVATAIKEKRPGVQVKGVQAQDYSTVCPALGVGHIPSKPPPHEP